jgi:hypothetical protein
MGMPVVVQDKKKKKETVNIGKVWRGIVWKAMQAI